MDQEPEKIFDTFQFESAGTDWLGRVFGEAHDLADIRFNPNYLYSFYLHWDVSMCLLLAW